MSPIIVAVIAGVVGLITGAVGSLIAPWVQWGIEKRREKLNYKRRLIISWRRFIGSKEFNQAEFKDTLTYGTMRPLLSEGVIKIIDSDTQHITIGNGDPFKRLLLDEINRIEKEWDLR